MSDDKKESKNHTLLLHPTYIIYKNISHIIHQSTELLTQPLHSQHYEIFCLRKSLTMEAENSLKTGVRSRRRMYVRTSDDTPMS